MKHKPKILTIFHHHCYKAEIYREKKRKMEEFSENCVRLHRGCFWFFLAKSRNFHHCQEYSRNFSISHKKSWNFSIYYEKLWVFSIFHEKLRDFSIFHEKLRDSAIFHEIYGIYQHFRIRINSTKTPQSKLLTVQHWRVDTIKTRFATFRLWKSSDIF